ncbi:adenosine deaminase [Microlunatus ginsengisoli]|uniref:adenosine deaminase n=1 Tax=Microlunatus ginsengisoli TaxID=363863 RepID=A0ABP7A9Z1_9ACTN
MSLDPELLRALPKVCLHDHLDGGLRPTTIVEIAGEIGHELPATDPDALRTWFVDSCNSGSLVDYLVTFDQTIAVMQRAQDLRRVAREFVEDLAADGVIYGEARWAPEQHTRAGLTVAQAVEAVRDGLAEGMSAAAERGHEIVVRQLVTAMRHVPEPTTEIAELAVRYRNDSVAGFDIAGAEKGFPPERFLASFQLLRQASAFYTIHAGEADDLRSIWGAVCLCDANRIGHGVAIADDVTVADDGHEVVGDFAAYVRDQQIALEMCPSSNVQTAAVPSLAEHPIARLDALGFRVTVNSDNQLMSGTNLSRELGLVAEQFDLGVEDCRRFAVNAAKSAFAPWDLKRRLVERITSF